MENRQRNMVDSDINLDSYKIPSKQIQRNRRIFYDLWRGSDDQAAAWLKRVQNCIRRCEYPTIIMEFLLFDRFVCGLNANELSYIQRVKKSWTLEQLLQHYLDENISTGHIETNSTDENGSLVMVKSEPTDEDCLQFGSVNESIADTDFFADIESNKIEDKYTLGENTIISIVYDTEETNCHLSFDEEEIDSEMPTDDTNSEGVDYKFSATDAVVESKSNKSNRGNLLRNQIEKKRRGRKYKYDLNSADANERCYACAECDRRFVTTVDLQRHMYTHTGERPYPCDQCDKAFTQPGNLNKHKKNVHNQNRSHAGQQ